MLKYIVLLVCMACTAKLSSTDELFRYINEPSNGLCVAREEGGIKVTATYLPTDLMLAREQGTGLHLDTLRSKYGKYIYISLSFSYNNKSLLESASSATRSELLQILSFRMGEYVQAKLDGNRELPLLDASYSRTYGLASTTDVLLVFDHSELKEAKEFALEVKDLGLGIGTSRLLFETKNWRDVPALEI